MAGAGELEESSALGLRAAGFRGAGFRAAGVGTAGVRAAGVGAAGVRAAGFRAAGFRAAGFRAAGFRAAGVGAAGVRADGFRAAGVTAAGVTAAGARAGFAPGVAGCAAALRGAAGFDVADFLCGARDVTDFTLGLDAIELREPAGSAPGIRSADAALAPPLSAGSAPSAAPECGASGGSECIAPPYQRGACQACGYPNCVTNGRQTDSTSPQGRQ